jgi:predicted nuclease of predicted toxin-antitoxin system
MGRFLIDASLPRSAKEIALALGHEAIDVRDTELGTAGDDQISIFVRENRLCILTRDRGFGNLSVYRPEDHFGIVVFHLPDQIKRDDVLTAISLFLQKEEVLAQLPGCLVIVDLHQLRIRRAGP